MVKSYRKTEEVDGVLCIECTECHQMLPANTEYYFKGNCALGLRSKCKECVMKRYADKSLEYRTINRDKINAQKREAARKNREIISNKRKKSRNSEEYKKKIRLYEEEHRSEINKRSRENKQKDKRGAKRLRTRRLIKKLGITCDCCSICGIKCKVQAHHPDYNKWNEIIFLCPTCHSRVHAGWFECPQDKIIDLLNFTP